MRRVIIVKGIDFLMTVTENTIAPNAAAAGIIRIVRIAEAMG